MRGVKMFKANRAVPLHTTAVSTLRIFNEKTEKIRRYSQ